MDITIRYSINIDKLKNSNHRIQYEMHLSTQFYNL